MATVATNLRNAIWLDLNTLVGITSGQILVSNLTDINNSVLNIVNTPVGTRYRQPAYGSSLNWLLMGPVSPDTAFNIEASLVQAIERWEPRVQIIRDQPKANVNSDNTGYNFVVTYLVPTFNQLYGLSLSIIK